MVYSNGHVELERYVFPISESEVGSPEDQPTIYPSVSQGLSNRERDYSDH